MWFLSQTFLGWNRLIYRAGCSNVNIFMMCSWHFCKHVGFDPRCLSGKWCVLLCFRILPTTLRVRPWKMIDWKMILSFWVPVTFQGRAVKLPRCVCFLCLDFLPSIRWLRTVFTDLLEDPSWVLRFASVFVLDGLHLMAFLKLTASYTALLFFFGGYPSQNTLEILHFEPPQKQRWMVLTWFSGFQLVWFFIWWTSGDHFQCFFPRRLLGRNSRRFGTAGTILRTLPTTWFGFGWSDGRTQRVRKGRMTDKRHVMVMSWELDFG